MLNSKEQLVIDALALAWNAFASLENEHPMDSIEFCSGIHRLQEKVMSRPARRAINGKDKP